MFSLLLLLFILHIFKPLPIEVACSSQVSDEFITKIINLTNGDEKVACLTFDDGSTTSVSPKILDILKTENIKATFFVIGKSVEAHPEIVKRAYSEGHYIANHGYSHNNSVLYKNSKSFINEVKKTDLAIEKAISLLLEMNYTYIDWNCLNNDSIKKYTNEQLLYNLK